MSYSILVKVFTVCKDSDCHALVERVQEPMHKNHKGVSELKSGLPKGSFITNF
jgi:hypothetical protein